MALNEEPGKVQHAGDEEQQKQQEPQLERRTVDVSIQANRLAFSTADCSIHGSLQVSKYQAAYIQKQWHFTGEGCDYLWGIA